MYAASAAAAVRDEEAVRQTVRRLESALEEAESDLRAAAAKRTAYEDEKKTPMTQNLTAGEIQQLEALQRDLQEQKDALLAASQARQEVRFGDRCDFLLISGDTGAQ